MKRFITVAALLLFMSLPSYAQLGFSLGPQAGVSFSSFQKAISDFYGTGFGGGVHGDLAIVKFITVRLSADYFRFSADADKFIPLYVAANPGTQASDFSFSGAGVGVFSIFANALGRLPTGSTITPYALVGMGISIISTSTGELTYQGTPQPQANVPSSSESKFGLNFGGGAELSVPFGSVFAEVKYVLVLTDPSSSGHIPVVLGATFGL